ncbi:MAG: DUF2203 family protein [Thermoanaerobaculia bacterium]|nr:DUF2203 family protein [Thermoanaerobaculia bacterium]
MARRIFTYQEALDSFPAVREITGEAVSEVRQIHSSSGPAGEDRRQELEAETRRIVERWAAQVEELGCEVKGLWLVDWDSGDGYYCWRYPEESLAHYHGYSEGFAGRVPIN